ncbi:unnamed protein product [Owenia fusiformis]|uniref:Uncharacterized protein n=1 Tax=Owenia fusiformis TaxID=6347 RepID=A0A8J1UFX5_OWEFU|nr:unnamed protein product [Owenia fusiformis]
MANSPIAQSSLSLTSMSLTTDLRKFILKLSKELSDDEVEDMKFLVDGRLDDVNSIKTARDLFGKLFKIGIIWDTNVDMLVDLLTGIDREDLVKKVNSFKEKNIDISTEPRSFETPADTDLDSSPSALSGPNDMTADVARHNTSMSTNQLNMSTSTLEAHIPPYDPGQRIPLDVLNTESANSSFELSHVSTLPKEENGDMCVEPSLDLEIQDSIQPSLSLLSLNEDINPFGPNGYTTRYDAEFFTSRTSYPKTTLGAKPIILSDYSSDESESLEDSSDEGDSTKVQLRLYQEYLAKPSLRKENTIVCCPTGSGKTLTAAYICFKLREEAMMMHKGERHFKTIFIVCIVNLKEQQMDNFKLMPFEDDVLAMIDDESDVVEVIKSRDVVFMTAQVLVNTLKSGRLKITDLDFIIIDECHHTTKGHPYNVIMQEFYLQEKERKPVSGRGSLPQILGLTASLGVGKNERAIDHCVTMCANLDCNSVTHVREKKYLDDLKMFRPSLQIDIILAVPGRNSDDPFLTTIQHLMTKICQKYKFSCNHEEGTEGYEGWSVGLKKDAESDRNWEHAAAASYLIMYTRTIETTKQLRRIDGLRVIEEEEGELCPKRKAPGVWDNELRQSLEEQKGNLEAFSDSEIDEANPMIKKLKDLLEDVCDRDFRGLILARTKAYTIALVDYIKGLQIPRVRVDRIVGKGQASDHAQTDKMQRELLKHFRTGKINVLVGTDVVQEGLDIPKCNFVIRYNFVSNEIGSVQGKGRARHVDSQCYLIVPKGSTNEKRENANLLKVEQMEAALKELDNKDPDVLKRDILREQDKMMEEYRNKKRRNEDPLYKIKPESITLFHKGCNKELCKGTDILRKNTCDYICVSDNFLQKISLEPRGKAKQFRTDTHIGVSVCNSCHMELGPVKEYKYGDRRRGHVLSSKIVMYSIDGEDGLRHIKQWSKIPWMVEEEQ